MLDSLTSKLVPKALVSGVTGTAFALLFGEPSLLLLAVFLLFFIDLLTGVWKGLHTSKFTSHALRKGVTKFILYCISIIVAHQFAVIPLLFWVEDAILALLSLTELASIGENMRALGFNFPDINKLFDFYKDWRQKNKEIS